MGEQSVKLSLADPYLKTTRAKVHLDALRGGLRLFSESKSDSFVGEDDLENGMYRLRFRFDDVPDDIWLIAGDLLYCLRASLDQLVWALAKLTTGYPVGTQFPILDKDIALDKDAKKRFEKYTTGVPAGAVHVIKSLQPYRGGDDFQSHLLWRLNLLCNIDKHRRIPLHGQMTAFHFPKFPKVHQSLMEFDQENDMVSVPAHLKSYMTVDPTFPVEVVFGDMAEGITCDFNGIERIYNFVSGDVIPRFARFFPH